VLFARPRHGGRDESLKLSLLMNGSAERADTVATTEATATAKGEVISQLERCEDVCRKLLRDIVFTGLELQSQVYSSGASAESESCSNVERSLENLMAEEKALRRQVGLFLSELRKVEQLARLFDTVKSEEVAVVALKRVLTEEAEKKFFQLRDAKEALSGTKLESVKSLLEAAARYPRISW
jgi:hypothetical protein